MAPFMGAIFCLEWWVADVSSPGSSIASPLLCTIRSSRTNPVGQMIETFGSSLATRGAIGLQFIVARDNHEGGIRINF